MTISIPLPRQTPALDWSRYVPLIALFAGLAWLGFGAESILRPHAEDYRNTLFFIPWLPTIVTVFVLHLLQPPGRFERFAANLLLGSMLLVVATQPGIIFDIAALKIGAGIGFAGFVLGTLAFGIASYRAGVLPRGLSIGLALTQVGTMAMGIALSPWVPLASDGSYSGAIVHGAVFTAAAIWLVRHGRRTTA